MIPIKLREQMGMEAGKEYSFFVHFENGHKFICIDCGTPETELEQAMKIVQASGMKIVQNDN